MSTSTVPPESLEPQVERARRGRWSLAAALIASGVVGYRVGETRGGRISIAVTVEPASTTFAPHLTLIAAGAAPAEVQAGAPRAPAAPATAAPPPPSPPRPSPPRPRPFADRGACPAVRGAAPAGRWIAPPVEVVGFAGAPSDSRWLAAWSRDEVQVSDDGGHTWARVLDGAGAVLDVDFDCHGRPLVVRAGAGLGVRDGGYERWLPVPGLELAFDAEAAAADDDDVVASYAPSIVGGGRAVAVLGHLTGGDAGAVISDDLGATWRAPISAGYYEGAELGGQWSGDVLHAVVPWADCDAIGPGAGLRYLRITRAGATVEREVSGTQTFALAGATVITWTASCGAGADDGYRWCAWQPTGTDRAVELPFGPDELHVIDGPADVVVADGRVSRLRATGVDDPRPWDPSWTPLATDRAGRLWGRTPDGTLVRR